MKNQRNPVAQKLLEAFTQFHRLNWKQSPIVGLKSSEIMVLFCIKKTVHPESHGIKVSDISKALRVAPPTITQLINSLEANGYVERTMDKADRRAVRVKITERGEGTIAQAADAFFESFNGLVEYLGENKSKELAELLSKAFGYFEERRREN
jgi:DNA-binding MarR family transcriptional regulator